MNIKKAKSEMSKMEVLICKEALIMQRLNWAGIDKQREEEKLKAIRAEMREFN